MTTAQRIAELRRLHGEATAGPWETIGRFVRRGVVVHANKGKADICDCYPDAEIYRNESDINSALIATTRNLLPVLIAAWELVESLKVTEPGYPREYIKKVIAYSSALKGVEDE